MNGTKKINRTLFLRHLPVVFPSFFQKIPQNTTLQQTNYPGLVQYIHFDKNNLVFCVNKNMIQYFKKRKFHLVINKSNNGIVNDKIIKHKIRESRFPFKRSIFTH